jgi:hypothetical protein
MKKKSMILVPLFGIVALAAPLSAEIILEGIQALEQVRRVLAPSGAVPKPKDAEAPEKAVPVDPAYADSIRFLNGDILHGNLVAIDAEKGIRWKMPDAKAEIEFLPAKLAKITVGSKNPAKPEKKSEGASLVRLTNGDELLGEVISVDTNQLVLATVYAGQMVFPRKNVQAIRMTKASSGAIFEGPLGMEGWTSSRGRSGAWRYVDGSFISSRPGTIGRDVKLPPMARIEFDLNWRGQLQFLLNLYTDGFEEYGNNAYMLQMNSGYIYLQRVRRNGGGHNLGQAEVPFMHTKNKMHVEILANKEARTLALLLDGTLVKQWKDNADWIGSGTGILFCQQGLGYTRISNIKVTEWDGKMEDTSAPAAKSKDDLIELSNRDKISGTLLSIKDGKVVFATAFANMDIPLERVSVIELAGAKAEVPSKKPTDVQAIFSTRGSLTFTLQKWDGQEVLASSPNFGSAKFVASAFKQFVFNIDKQKQQEPVTEIFGTDDGEIDQ